MLNRSNMQWTAKTLANQIRKENVLFDCAIQRSFVWDMTKKRMLIDSMLRNYPINALFFNRRDDNKYDALDGKQRSNAIRGFMDGEYTLENLEPFYNNNKEEFDANGLKFEELPEWMQDQIKEYSITIYYFDGITDEEIAEFFFRINNGKPLSSIELTRAKANSLDKFQRIAALPAIADAISDKGKLKYNDETIAMQAWEICFLENPDFTTAKFRDVIQAADVTDEQLERLTDACDYVSAYLRTLNTDDKDGARVYKRIRSKTHLVSAIYLANKILDTLTAEEYGKKLDVFFRGNETSISPEYNAACRSGSARNDAIVTRKTALDKLIR
ncbi:MAG: DUF262 domain-containing protein [Clostridia bacterium]|nr:DUF262 domain-containing protein [Clostridia bacterium]